MLRDEVTPQTGTFGRTLKNILVVIPSHSKKMQITNPIWELQQTPAHILY